MKVNSTQFNSTRSLTTAPQAENKASSANKQPKASYRMTENSAQSSALREAQTQLQNMPDIDMDKVMELKSAIKEGKIQVNIDELTTAMLKYHQG